MDIRPQQLHLLGSVGQVTTSAVGLCHRQLVMPGLETLQPGIMALQTEGTPHVGQQRPPLVTMHLVAGAAIPLGHGPVLEPTTKTLLLMATEA